MANPKKLYRSKENKMVAGVCGGLGEYFNTDPVWIRLAAVLLALMDGVGIIVYIIAWIIIPVNPKQKGAKTTEAEKAVEKAQKALKSKNEEDKSYLFGMFIIGLGAILLIRNVFDWIDDGIIWALALIALGFYLLMRRKK